MHAREGHHRHRHRRVLLYYMGGSTMPSEERRDQPHTELMTSLLLSAILPRQFIYEAETSGEPILHPQLTRFWSTAQRTDMVDTFPGHGETHQD